MVTEGHLLTHVLNIFSGPSPWGMATWWPKFVFFYIVSWMLLRALSDILLQMLQFLLDEGKLKGTIYLQMVYRQRQSEQFLSKGIQNQIHYHCMWLSFAVVGWCSQNLQKYLLYLSLTGACQVCSQVLKGE